MIAYVDVFYALADPTRRSIVDILSTGPLPAGDIAGQFEISPPAVSQHLKILREAGLLAMKIDAQRRIYQLDPSGFREVDRWLGIYRKFWLTALDALEVALRADRPEGAEKKQAEKKTKAVRRGTGTKKSRKQ